MGPLAPGKFGCLRGEFQVGQKRKWLVACAVRKSDLRPDSEPKGKVVPWAGGEGSKKMLCSRHRSDMVTPVTKRC